MVMYIILFLRFCSKNYISRLCMFRQVVKDFNHNLFNRTMSSKKSILRTSRGIPRPVSARSNRSELSFDNSMLKPKSAGKFYAIKPTEKLLQDVDPVPVISGCDVESPKSPQGFDHMYVF